MYKVFFIILAVILLISTVLFGVFAPKMHKNIFLYDADLKIVLKENDNVKTDLIPTRINTVQNRFVDKKTVVSTSNTIVNTPAKIKETPLKADTSSTVKPQVNNQNVRNNQPEAKNTADKPVPKTSVKPDKTSVPQQVQAAPQTKQQELILWNKWRSDLQNRIMRDVKLPIVKQGTIFKFSFDVDKNGKITNVSTWSTDPVYTPYAIQYIAPVIRSYQGRDFMSFPSGSNRVTTTVSGAWKISDKTTYSTPEDYKDIEKIRN